MNARHGASLVLIVTCLGCGGEYENPFAGVNLTRPPPADAEIGFVSAATGGAADRLRARDAGSHRIGSVARHGEHPSRCPDGWQAGGVGAARGGVVSQANRRWAADPTGIPIDCDDAEAAS